MLDFDTESKYFNPKSLKEYEKKDARSKEILANILGEITPERVRLFTLPTNEAEKLPSAIPLFKTKEFPEWKICYNVKKHRENILYDGKLKNCPKCNKPSDGYTRFIRACSHGHMDDVNWNYAVHRGKECSSRYFNWVSTGASLAEIKISCPICSGETTMGEIYNIKFECTGRMPESRREYNAKCNSNMIVLQRQSTSLRQPELITILEIPAKKGESNGEDGTRNLFHIDEYEYITGVIEDTSEADDNFCKEKTKLFAGNGDIPPLEITQISKLKTITIQYGYTRNVKTSDEKRTVIIGKETTDKDGKWFPCFESIGEGLWITLPKNMQNLGEKNKSWWNHDETLESKFGVSNWWNCYNSPIWAWYHTLSHALIKSTSLYCGYSIASIRERVYLSRDGKAGAILLYTSSSGEDGSLGGLSGVIDFFEEISSAANEMISICSNDPFCINEIKKQNKPNGSACHSCLMLSETSCEHGNHFIDRHLIKGSNE